MPLLTVGFNRRFAPLAQQLFDFYKDHAEPMHIHYRVNAGYIPLNHWTQDPALGGGRIIGEACHFIDFITFLVGASPVSVTAHALPDNGKYREDNVSMTFTFPDGSIGVVDYLANGDKSFPKERVEVFCGGKIAVLDDFRALELVENGNRKTIKGAQDKGWKNEMIAFAKSIREGGQPPIAIRAINRRDESRVRGGGVDSEKFTEYNHCMNARLQKIEQICKRYKLKALYVFGSRSADMLQAIRDDQYQPASSQSDLDIGVLFHSPFSIENKVNLTFELENLFGLPDIDLFILQEVDAFLAANIIRGERIFAENSYLADEYELFVLRRAGDLAELERQRMAMILQEA